MLNECYFLVSFKIKSSWNVSFWERFFFNPNSSKGSRQDWGGFTEDSTNSLYFGGICWRSLSNIKEFSLPEGLSVIDLHYVWDGRSFLPCLQLLGVPMVANHPSSRCPVSRLRSAPLSQALSKFSDFSRESQQFSGPDWKPGLWIPPCYFHCLTRLTSLPFCAKVVTVLNPDYPAQLSGRMPLCHFPKTNHTNGWEQTLSEFLSCEETV